MKSFFYWLFSKNEMSGLRKGLFMLMPVLALVIVGVVPERNLVESSRIATLEILTPIVLVLSLGMTLPAYFARKYLEKDTERAKKLISRIRTKDPISYPSDNIAMDAMEIYIGLLIFIALVLIWIVYKSLAR